MIMCMLYYCSILVQYGWLVDLLCFVSLIIVDVPSNLSRPCIVGSVLVWWQALGTVITLLWCVWLRA